MIEENKEEELHESDPLIEAKHSKDTELGC